MSAAALAALVTSGVAAQEGLGWSSMRLDNMPKADNAFNSSGGRVDAEAGWVFVKWTMGQYGDVVTKAEAVLLSDPSYSFQYDTTVDFEDLILHQAYAYFHLGMFAECISKIQQLDAGFVAGPTDPGIDITLLTKLEELRAAI